MVFVVSRGPLIPNLISQQYLSVLMNGTTRIHVMIGRLPLIITNYATIEMRLNNTFKNYNLMFPTRQIMPNVKFKI